MESFQNNKFLKIFITVLIVFFILLCFLIVYLFLQNQKLSKELLKYQTQVSTTPTPSPTVEDKVLAIQITVCCSCPTKVSRSLIGIDGWVIYEKGKNYSRFLPEECKRVDCQPCPPIEIEIPTPTTSDIINISDTDLSNGWYWGDKNQKKPGTPNDWVYAEEGRSSCWHKIGVNCEFSPEQDSAYKCPENGWVNCMPGPNNPELKWECTEEYQQWAKINCPDYQGVAY